MNYFTNGAPYGAVPNMGRSTFHSSEELVQIQAGGPFEPTSSFVGRSRSCVMSDTQTHALTNTRIKIITQHLFPYAFF